MGRGIGRRRPILDPVLLSNRGTSLISVGVCRVFTAVRAVLSPRRRGPLCGCVSGLLVAVVPLGERGHWGTWASAAAGCGLSARSGQDLEHGFHRRGLWASWLCSTWDRPGPGMKPVFPAWARDGFLRSRRGSPRPKLEMDILPSPAWDGRVSERSGPEKGLHREGLTFVSHRPALLLLLEVS